MSFLNNDPIASESINAPLDIPSLDKLINQARDQVIQEVKEREREQVRQILSHGKESSEKEIKDYYKLNPEKRPHVRKGESLNNAIYREYKESLQHSKSNAMPSR